MRFNTSFKFKDRKTKAEYVWQKYSSCHKGRIQVVGADKCYLKEYLPTGTDYVGVGLGEGLDRVIDLEKDKLPFEARSFDCVLCLDVLEHLDNPHTMFDDLCRVSRCWVIIALPNPWKGIIDLIQSGDYLPGRAFKFYGLPVTPPPDRHKWFFHVKEAEAFIRFRAKGQGFRVVQIDYGPGPPAVASLRQQLAWLALRILGFRHLKFERFLPNSVWAVLERE